LPDRAFAFLQRLFVHCETKKPTRTAIFW
jgi:hypothetical protein